MRQHIISTSGERQWQGIPAIERAANGRLWCAFFSGGEEEPKPENHILITSSTDDGVTWSEPEIIVDPAGQTRAYDPALWHDPQGRLWLFYNEANVGQQHFTVCAIRTDDASGASPEWSSPRRVELDVPFAFRLNKPTIASNGEWLLPVTWSREAPPDWFWFEEPKQLQGVAISSDEGDSWSLHGAVEAPKWALENMIVEREEDSLWMLIRAGGGRIYQCLSRDGGKTWSAATASDIINPGTRFFIRRLDSGRILLINTPDPEKRQRICASLSPQDDGSGFGKAVELDARNRVSYPDAVQAPDGTIYAVHDFERYGAGEIVLSVFTEQELL